MAQPCQLAGCAAPVRERGTHMHGLIDAAGCTGPDGQALPQHAGKHASKQVRCDSQRGHCLSSAARRHTTPGQRRTVQQRTGTSYRPGSDSLVEQDWKPLKLQSTERGGQGNG